MAAGRFDQIPIKFNSDAGLIRNMDETVFINWEISLHGKTVIILRYKVFKVFTVFNRTA